MAIKINFTNTVLTEIKVDPDQKQIFADTKEDGLQLFVHKGGKKTFVLRKRFKDKNTFHIGKYPDLMVYEARKIAMKYKNQIAHGEDPASVDRIRQVNEITFGEMFENYIERYAKLNTKSWKDDKREVTRIFGHLFKRTASSITREELQKIHENLGINSGKPHANRSLERVSPIFNKNIEWGWNHINPCLGIKKFKKIARDRFLQPEEIPIFFKALESEENQTNKDCIYLLLLTGARKSNVSAMKWEEISFIAKQWRIPDTKNDEPVIIPLTEQALDILERRKKENILLGSQFVLPGNGRTGHIADIKKAWHRILKRAGIQNLTIHDLRRSVGSWMAITGSTTAVIGKQLGHKSKAATAVYERLNIDPVREGLEKAINKIIEYSKPK